MAKIRTLDYAKVQSEILKILVKKPDENSRIATTGIIDENYGAFMMVCVDAHIVYLIPKDMWFLMLPETSYNPEKAMKLQDLWGNIQDAVPAEKTGIREFENGSIACRYATDDDFCYIDSKFLKPFGDIQVSITGERGCVLIKSPVGYPLGIVMPIIL